MAAFSEPRPRADLLAEVSMLKLAIDLLCCTARHETVGPRAARLLSGLLQRKTFAGLVFT